MVGVRWRPSRSVRMDSEEQTGEAAALGGWLPGHLCVCPSEYLQEHHPDHLQLSGTTFGSEVSKGWPLRLTLPPFKNPQGLQRKT